MTFEPSALSSSGLRKRLPKVAVAGPTAGALPWLQNLRGFLAAEPTLRVVTFHRYPLNRCFTTLGSPNYPTVANLLSSSASRGCPAESRPTSGSRIVEAIRSGSTRSTRSRAAERAGVSDTFASGALGPRRFNRRGPVRCRRGQYPHVRRGPVRSVHLPSRRYGMVRFRAPGVLRTPDVRVGSSAWLAATARDTHWKSAGARMGDANGRRDDPPRSDQRRRPALTCRLGADPRASLDRHARAADRAECVGEEGRCAGRPELRRSHRDWDARPRTAHRSANGRFRRVPCHAPSGDRRDGHRRF